MRRKRSVLKQSIDNRSCMSKTFEILCTNSIAFSLLKVVIVRRSHCVGLGRQNIAIRSCSSVVFTFIHICSFLFTLLLSLISFYSPLLFLCFLCLFFPLILSPLLSSPLTSPFSFLYIFCFLFTLLTFIHPFHSRFRGRDHRRYSEL